MKDDRTHSEMRLTWLPEAVRQEYSAAQKAQEDGAALHAGDLCPHCKKGRLDYNGLLNLQCGACGSEINGSAGCT